MIVYSLCNLEGSAWHSSALVEGVCIKAVTKYKLEQALFA